MGNGRHAAKQGRKRKNLEMQHSPASPYQRPQRKKLAVTANLTATTNPPAKPRKKPVQVTIDEAGNTVPVLNVEGSHMSQEVEDLAQALLDMQNGNANWNVGNDADDVENGGDEEEEESDKDDKDDRISPPPPLPPPITVTYEVPYGNASRVIKMKSYTPWNLMKTGAKPRAKVLENDETLTQLYEDINEYVTEQMGKKGNTKGIVKPFSITLVDLHDTAVTKTGSTKDNKPTPSKKLSSNLNGVEENTTDKDEHIWLKEINQAHWCEQHKEADYMVPPENHHEKFTIKQLSQWAFLCVCSISLQLSWINSPLCRLKAWLSLLEYLKN